MRFRRKSLPQLLAERILEPASGDLSDLVTDAYLRQDMEWLRVDADRTQNREEAAHEDREYAEHSH